MMGKEIGKGRGARDAKSETHLVGSRLDFSGCEERLQFCDAEVAYANTPATQECTSVRRMVKKRKDRRRKRMTMGTEVKWVQLKGKRRTSPGRRSSTSPSSPTQLGYRAWRGVGGG